MSSEKFRIRRNALQYYLQYYARRAGDATLRRGSHARLSRHFVFMHIPKAGGSSLRLFFAGLFGAGAVYPEVKLNMLPAYAEVASDRPRLYLGHFGHHFAVEAGAIKATVLRHPIERLLSVYSYAMDPGPRAPLIGGLDGHMSLIEFLRSDNPSIRVNIDNTQTWQIAYGYTTQERNAYRASGLDDVYAVAASNLSGIEHVGVLEHLDRFKQQLLDCYPARYPPRQCGTDPVVNPSRSRLVYSDLDSSEKQALEAVVQDDIRLYELARRRAE